VSRITLEGNSAEIRIARMRKIIGQPLSPASLDFIEKWISEKLKELAQDPFNIRKSKPVTSKDRRTARVGGYRLLFVVEGDVLMVSDCGPRGQIYR